MIHLSYLEDPLRVKLTNSQKHLAEVCEALTSEELRKAQRVHINDYQKLKAEGRLEEAANVLGLVNDFGVLLEHWDRRVPQ